MVWGKGGMPMTLQAINRRLQELEQQLQQLQQQELQAEKLEAELAQARREEQQAQQVLQEAARAVKRLEGLVSLVWPAVLPARDKRSWRQHAGRGGWPKASRRWLPETWRSWRKLGSVCE